MNLNADILPSLPAKHRQALWHNLIGQGILLFLSAITLDGGVLNTTVLIATAAYWAACAITLVRRYRKLTANDLIFFKWGFVGAWLLVYLLVPIIALLLRY